MNKTILVIDDDENVRQMAFDILTNLRYRVLCANDGEDGLQSIHRNRPNLILCDIMMPGLNGFEVLNAVRSDLRVSATPFIFLTALHDRESMRLGMTMSADDYLPKPFAAEELVDAISAAFRRRSLVEMALQRSRMDAIFDVFMSYSRRDMGTMQRIRDDLVDAGLRVWTDEHLEPGTPSWEQAVIDALRQTASVVAILSPDAERSKWVGRELAMAETLDLRIFPLLARGTERNAVPLRLVSHQWIDGRQDYASAIDSLIDSLRRHLEKLSGLV
jgi:DNA-binding response OmpR family regulator